MQTDAMTAVNEYFERVLTGVPSIKAYLDTVAATHGAQADPKAQSGDSP
jgi:hypothetical protein